MLGEEPKGMLVAYMTSVMWVWNPEADPPWFSGQFLWLIATILKYELVFIYNHGSQNFEKSNNHVRNLQFFTVSFIEKSWCLEVVKKRPEPGVLWVWFFEIFRPPKKLILKVLYVWHILLRINGYYQNQIPFQHYTRPDLEAGDSGILVGLLCWVSSFPLLSTWDLVLHGPGSNMFLSLLNFLFIPVPTPHCDQTLNSFCCITLLPLFRSTIVSYKNLGKTLELFVK